MNGETLFDAERSIHVPARRRRFGYVFQEGRLFPHLTVRRNLLYGHALVPAAERYIVPVSSGIIAGESIMGIAIALLGAGGLL